MKKVGLVLLGLVIVLGLWLMGQYNNLIGLNERVDTQWAQVETNYQRRFDLIPNLVETVKGISEQEQEVFGMIAEARTRYAGAATTEEQVEATNQLETSLGRLLVIMENYPELRSSESYQTLMVQLEGTENRINVERGRFNETIRDYNLVTKRFPTNMIAGMMGFEEKTYFEAAPAAEQAPAVQF
jgi:LemA protein